jgi:hypothetical protein
MSDLLLEINTAVTQHKQQGETKLSDIAIIPIEIIRTVNYSKRDQIYI